MAEYESISSLAGDQSTDFAIPKPTGLAVGELMLAGIYICNDGSDAVTISTPSGWTLLENEDISTQDSQLSVFSKTADASDVAASTFTFATGGSAGAFSRIGHIVRVSSFGLIDDSASGQATSTTSFSTAGFTPTEEDCLLVMFAASDDTSAATKSAYAIASDNPSWTERATTSFNDSTRDPHFSVATASRPENTATGNFSFTISGNSSNRVAGVLVAIAPQVSGTADVIPADLYVWGMPFAKDADISFSGDDPSPTKYDQTAWEIRTKTDDTWTDQTK